MNLIGMGLKYGFALRLSNRKSSVIPETLEILEYGT